MKTEVKSNIICAFTLLALLLVCASAKMQYAKHLTFHEQKGPKPSPPYQYKEERTYFASAQTS
jgi:hypothetical protein